MRFLVCTVLKRLCRGYWIFVSSYFWPFCLENWWWILSQCSCSMQIMLMVQYSLHFWSFYCSKYRIIIINVLLLVVSLWKFLLASQQTWWKLWISFSFPVHFICYCFLPVVPFFYILTFVLTYSQLVEEALFSYLSLNSP